MRTIILVTENHQRLLVFFRTDFWLKQLKIRFPGQNYTSFWPITHHTICEFQKEELARISPDVKLHNWKWQISQLLSGLNLLGKNYFAQRNLSGFLDTFGMKSQNEKFRTISITCKTSLLLELFQHWHSYVENSN